MASAAIKANFLNGWVNTSSQAGGGAFRKMITVQAHVTRKTDVRV